MVTVWADLVTPLDGSRVSEPLLLSAAAVAGGSLISWIETIIDGTEIVISCAVNDDPLTEPLAYDVAVNGGAIPGITPGDNLIGKYLWVKQDLLTTYGGTPELHSLTVHVYSKSAVAVGVWESPVIDMRAVLDELASAISWAAVIPAGCTLTVEAKTSEDGIVWGAYEEISASGDSLPAWEGYLQYWLTLGDPDGFLSPLVSNVTAVSTAAVYRAEGRWISPLMDLRSLNPGATSVVWTGASTPAGTSIAAEMRCGKDVGHMGAWEPVANGGVFPSADWFNQARITLTPNALRSATPTVGKLTLTANQAGGRGIWISPTVDATIVADQATGHVSIESVPGDGVVIIWSRSSPDGITWTEWVVSDTITGSLLHDPADFVQIAAVITADAELERLTVSFDGTPEAVLIKNNFSPGGQFYFDTLLDYMIIVNGIDAPRKYDGGTFQDDEETASLTTDLEGDNNDLVYTAKTEGANGNLVSIEYANPGKNSQTIGVETSIYDIKVLLATDDTGDSATAEIGAGENGIVTVTIDAGGTHGHEYSIEVRTNINPSKELAATLAEKKILVTLGTDADALPDNAKNTATLVSAAIDALDGISAAASGSGADPLTLEEEEKDFAEGTDPAVVSKAFEVRAAVIEHTFSGDYVGVKHAVGSNGTGVVPVMSKTSLSGGVSSSLVGGSPPYAKYVVSHKNRLWLALGSRIYFSDLLDFDSWPVLNFIDISPNDGDVVTGLMTYGDYLVITKGHSLWMLTGDGMETFMVRRIHSDRGAYAPKSLIKVNDTVCFISDDGIYFTDFSQAVIISERIRRFWRTLNPRRLDQVTSWFHDHKLFVAAPSGSSIRNDTLIVYDVLRQAFTGIYTGWDVSCWVSFREGGRIASYYGSSTETQVTEMETGYSDNNAPYIMKWRSREIDFGSPEIYKRLNKMLLQVSPAATEAIITFAFYVNGQYIGQMPVAVPAGSGNLIHNIQVLASKAGVVGGQRLSLEITQAVLNNPVGIQLMSIEHMAKGIKPTIFR